jgi:hypothetical protein
VSDRSVLILALCVFGTVLADMLLNGGMMAFFLVLKVTDLVEWLSFWR